MHEYEAPYKLMERCEPELDEKTLSRFVYSGRVRLEKAPGELFTVKDCASGLQSGGCHRDICRGWGSTLRMCSQSCAGRVQPSPTAIRQVKTLPAETGRADAPCGGSDAKPQQPERQQRRQAWHRAAFAGNNDHPRRRIGRWPIVPWWRTSARRWGRRKVFIFRSSVSNGHRLRELGGREKNGRR